jgi:hypothetical protein
VNVLILHPTTEVTGRRGRDRMAVGFTTTYAIRVVVSSNPVHGRVYSIQHYVALCLLVTCDRSVVFLLVLRFVFSTNNTDRYDITEILLKVALNAPNPNFRFHVCIEVYVLGVSILLPFLRLFLLLNFGTFPTIFFFI